MNNSFSENRCDFCGRECSEDRLFIVTSGLTLTDSDWKEVVCNQCDAGKSSYLGLITFPLTAFLRSS